MAKIKNYLLNTLADSVRSKKIIPSRKEISSAIKGSTVSEVAIGLKKMAQKARPMAEPMAKKAAVSQTKKAIKSPMAKELAVNTGGFVAGKTVGDLGGGLPGAVAVDAAGASLTRRLINKGYADVKAFRGRKKGESRANIQKRAERKRRTLEKIDRKGNNNIGDVSGSIIGNTAAEIGNRLGVGIPMKGAAVAMRSNPQVTENISKRLKGQQSTTDAIKNSVKEVVNDNVKAVKGIPGAIKKTIRRGNARERLIRMKGNKAIRNNLEVVDYALRDFKERKCGNRRKVYLNKSNDFSESLYGYKRIA